MGEDKNVEKKDDSGPVTVVLKVFMHCEACAGQVEKSLRGFQGVDAVEVDMKNNKVTVKGRLDPKKICERVEKKSRKKTELLSPLPKKKDDEKKPEKEKKPEEKKDKQPAVATVVLKVNMHCEGCGEELRKIILKIKGVQSVEVDLKGQKITVRGTMESKSMVEHLQKKAKKHVEIVPPKKDAEKKDGADKKGDGKSSEASAPKYVIQYVHPPQLFSDENPNACSIM